MKKATNIEALSGALKTLASGTGIREIFKAAIQAFGVNAQQLASAIAPMGKLTAVGHNSNAVKEAKDAGEICKYPRSLVFGDVDCYLSDEDLRSDVLAAAKSLAADPSVIDGKGKAFVPITAEAAAYFDALLAQSAEAGLEVYIALRPWVHSSGKELRLSVLDGSILRTRTPRQAT